MAKDKSTEGALALVPKLDANIGLDKNDVIAIAVSKCETVMNQKIVSLDKSIKDAEKRIKDNDKKLRTAISAIAEKHTKKAAADFIKAGKTFGKSLTTDTTWDFRHRCHDDQKEISVTLCIRDPRDTNGYNDTFSLSDVVPLTKKEQDLQELIQKDRELITATKEEIVQWRRRLSKIDSLERQYRAKFAEASLSQSEAGRALLDAIDSKHEEDVLALPGLY